MMLTTGYIDLDGVFADFVGACARLMKFDPAQVIVPGQFGIHNWLGVNKQWIWDRIDAQGVDFWENMEPYPWTDELWRMLTWRFQELRIVTHPRPSEGCIVGKLRWLRKHLPGAGEPIFMKEKWRLSSPGCVLVDDYDVNCTQFVNPILCHRGRVGHSVVFPQMWNSKWDSLCDGTLPPTNRVRHVEDMLDAVRNL